jgi:lycopene cyclase domain-containing protein
MRHLAYVFVLAGCLAAAIWPAPILKVNVFRRWRRLLLTVLPVTLVFALWDLGAIAAGHWKFDKAQTTGIVLPGGLPLDEILFFVVIPICAILGFEATRAVLQRPAGDEAPGSGAGATGPAGLEAGAVAGAE